MPQDMKSWCLSAAAAKFQVSEWKKTVQVTILKKHIQWGESFSNMDNILLLRGKQQIKTNAFATFISPLWGEHGRTPTGISYSDTHEHIEGGGWADGGHTADIFRDGGGGGGGGFDGSFLALHLVWAELGSLSPLPHTHSHSHVRTHTWDLWCRRSSYPVSRSKSAQAHLNLVLHTNHDSLAFSLKTNDEAELIHDRQ